MDLGAQVKNNFFIKLMTKNLKIICCFIALFFTQKVSSQKDDVLDDRAFVKCLIDATGAKVSVLVINNAKQIVKIIAEYKILNESSSIGFFNQNLRYKIWTVSSSNKPILITAVNAVITLIFILNT